MRLTPTLVVAASTLVVNACSGSPDTLPSAAAPASMSARGSGAVSEPTIGLDVDGGLRAKDAAPTNEFFVWTREEEEDATTYRIDLTGRAVEKLDGIVVATAAGLWQWQTEDHAVATVPCEHEDEEGHLFVGEPVTPGTATRASLRLLASGAEQVLVEPGIDLLGNADVRHDVGVVASLGPYVFVEEVTETYACGAHGNTGVAAMIWNAATGTAIAAPTDLGPLEALRAMAIRELTDEEDENDVFVATDDNLELTELVPRFATDGSLVLGLQWTAPACYACSRGGWSSYTKSTLVDGTVTPALFAPFAEAPPAVRAFLKAHPDIAMGGWSAR